MPDLNIPDLFIHDPSPPNPWGPGVKTIIPIPQENPHSKITVRVSGRHIHLAENDLAALFGPGHKLQKFKDLNQPGQFAAKETLTIVGPKGVIEGVRVLGPLRNSTQVEISGTDGYKLGVDPPVRDSGEIDGTPGIVLVGPKGAVNLDMGLILAATHIHMHTSEAKALELQNGDRVQVLVDGERDLIFTEVLVRVSDNFNTEMHVDTDEANAAVIEDGNTVQIIAKTLIN